MAENTNAWKAILGLGLGFGALGIAYYLYKNKSSSSSSSTTEEEATVTYGGYGGEYAGISEDSGGAVTNTTTTQESALDKILNSVLVPLLTTTQTTTTQTSTTDDNTSISVLPVSQKSYDSITHDNSYSYSDEQADQEQVSTGNNAGTITSPFVNTGNNVNQSVETEDNYLNTYGLTSSQYNSGLENWMSSYGGMSNKDVSPDYADGKTYEEMYQNYLKTQKYYFENSNYYDDSGDNWMITDNALESQLSENAKKYRTESYDTAQQDATMLSDKKTTGQSVSELQDQASQKNKYSYAGEASTGSTNTKYDSTERSYIGGYAGESYTGTTDEEDAAYSQGKADAASQVVRDRIESGDYDSSQPVSSDNSATGEYHTRPH